jgi:hypothetical protein
MDCESKGVVEDLTRTLERNAMRSSKRFGGGLAALLLFIVAGGCTAEIGGPSSETEVGSTTAELGTRYTWSQGDPPVTMLHQSQGMCFLNTVSGHFEGTGEAVQIDNINGYWTLEGRSQQAGVYAVSICVPWSQLSSNGGWQAGWGYWVDATLPLYPKVHRYLWADDSFCFLGGVSGSLYGFANGATVQMDPNTHTWRVDAETPLGGQMSSQGICANFTQAGPARWAGGQIWTQGTSARNLGPTSDRVCALTTVRGRFRGAGESVTVFQTAGSWWLSGTSQQTGVYAEANCLYLHQ